MVPERPRLADSLLRMVAFDDFKTRLEHAMREASVDPEALRAHLRVTRQAVNKLLKGTSKKMEAGNNIEAAALLGVDPYWLATGKGSPASQRLWPFPNLTPEQWLKISPEMRRGAESMLLSALPPNDDRHQQNNDAASSKPIGKAVEPRSVLTANRQREVAAVVSSRAEKSSKKLIDAPPNRRSRPPSSS